MAEEQDKEAPEKQSASDESNSGSSSGWMQVSGVGTLETVAIWGLPLVFLAAIAITVFAWHTD